ncbi:MAG: hypothetical protein J0L50_11575 [Sphingomonadales bacterium]|nr:hypothetical protein [Sphingomonadales bacterium]
MDADRTTRALARIEQALARIEAAARQPRAAEVQRRHDKLKAAVQDSLQQLDLLIEGTQG